MLSKIPVLTFKKFVFHIQPFHFVNSIEIFAKIFGKLSKNSL